MALPVIVIRRSTDEHEAQTRVASERVRVRREPRRASERVRVRREPPRAGKRVRVRPSLPRGRQTNSLSLGRVPKRPPRVVRELPVPHDLRGDGPTCALVVGGDPGSPVRGELWHTDVMELFGKLVDGSVDLVIADPPYAIAKADWDEFESPEVYLAWCDGWLAEVARVLAPHGSAYVCGFSENLADIKARSARRFASCRWLVWYYRNKANLGRDWGRSHESILHLRKADARIDVDAIRIPYNGHTTRYPARRQAGRSRS